MSERIYAISDIHGHLDQLRAALELVNLAGDPGAELILLGDYIDRGPDSCGVLVTVKELQQRFGSRVVALLGNHDDWFLDWLDGDDQDLSWLLGDNDLGTIRTFLEPIELAHALGHDDPASDSSSLDGPTMNHNLKQAILHSDPELIAWLRRLPRIYETGTQIFVHAGIDEDAGDLWRAATPDEMLTEKYPASTGPFLKTIIAGHVGTATLSPDGSSGVFHDGASHWYIDGTVEKTGRLNILRYDTRTGRYEGLSA